MAINDAVELIKETQRGLKATSTGVSKAKEAYDELQRQITNAQARLRRKIGNEHAETIAKGIIETLKKGNLLVDALTTQIELATTAGEFSKEVFKEKLYIVANDKDIYKLIPIGSGWNLHLATQIVFEEVAGRLEDYARGVKSYRASLKVKIGTDQTRGLKATSWWLTHVYRTSLEDSTIDGRIGITGRVAPFWKLLDAGTVALPSDRPDGSYNPLAPQKPTGFVSKAELEINKLFDESFKEQKAIEMEEAEQFKLEIEKAKEIRTGFSQDLKSLTTEYNKNQTILSRLGDKARYADEDKLAEAAKRLRAGQEFETSRISLGSGRSLTISVKKFKGIMEY